MFVGCTAWLHVASASIEGCGDSNAAFAAMQHFELALR